MFENDFLRLVKGVQPDHILNSYCPMAVENVIKMVITIWYIATGKQL